MVDLLKDLLKDLLDFFINCEGSLRQLKDLDERVRIVENAGRDNKSALTQLIT